jgi:hypothetical protein
MEVKIEGIASSLACKTLGTLSTQVLDRLSYSFHSLKGLLEIIGE